MKGLKRFTERTEYGGVKYEDNYYIITCYPQNEDCLRPVDKMAIRLAELEDKIEQGTLIELPCKVGDTVYYETFIKSRSQGIQPHKVIGFVLEVVTQDFGGFGVTAVPIKAFGKDVFLAREEAEKGLKNLQE